MNNTIARVFAIPVIVATLQTACLAQHTPALANNAALQYYSAFLQMKDADLSDADLQELSSIVNGSKVYDEAKFGKLMEENSAAVETMLVGTSMPACDWGLAPLAAKLGWQTPVPYFWRSRALGRLNILYALRAWSKGDRDEAVRVLSAGMKFSRDISNLGPLVPALVAKMLLVQQLSVADRFTNSGKLTSAEKHTLMAALEQLGPDGLNWQAAADVEMKGVKRDLSQIQSASDPRQYYKIIWNENPPREFHGVTAQDYADLMEVTSAYSSLFRDNDPSSVERAVRSSTPLIQRMIPSPSNALKSRAELKQALEQTKAKLKQ